MSKILELSSRSSKGGRRQIRMALLTIHKEGETNLNGIHWEERYVLANLDSIKGIPICASFLYEEKKVPYNHGYTETVERVPGKPEPLFEDSEGVGHIEYAKIENIEVNGKSIRALVAYGYLYYQRYPNFCDYLRDEVNDTSMMSSIEIVGVDNKNIVYDGGYHENYRVPQIFDFSATAIISVKEADDGAKVLEVAQKNKEEKPKMTEKEVMEIVQKSISEMNSKQSEVDKQIAELNSKISDKDKEIKESNDAKAKADKESADKDQIIKELEDENKKLNEEIAACKTKELNSALDEKLANYSDDEKKYAESEINSYKEDPMKGDVDAIILKINAGIGVKAKEEAVKIAEQNAAKKKEDLNIFTEINEVSEDNEDDINIF